MKWTVQRYVLREVVQTWLAVTGVLVAILVSNQLSRVLGQAADNQYGRHVVFDLIALGAVMNLSVIVPVGLLLSVVLTLGRLYHDSEMAALQACGYAPARLLAPLFVFAAVIAVGLAWLSFFQVPRADSQVQSLRRSAIKEAQFGQLDAGRFRSFSGGAAVFSPALGRTLTTRARTPTMRAGHSRGLLPRPFPDGARGVFRRRRPNAAAAPARALLSTPGAPRKRYAR